MENEKLKRVLLIVDVYNEIHKTCREVQNGIGQNIDLERASENVFKLIDKVKTDNSKVNSELLERYNEAVEACNAAMRVVDLWAPNYSKDEIKESEIGEIAALSMMRKYFEQVINKHKEG